MVLKIYGLLHKVFVLLFSMWLSTMRCSRVASHLCCFHLFWIYDLFQLTFLYISCVMKQKLTCIKKINFGKSARSMLKRLLFWMQTLYMICGYFWDITYVVSSILDAYVYYLFSVASYGWIWYFLNRYVDILKHGIIKL